MIIGVVGKANVGKSTFFKAATLAGVEIANYPFTTIDPNKGVGFVKVDCIEKHFNVKCKPRFGYCANNKRFVPVQLIDVAGLVPEAYLGKGRGNEFLSDLNQADALIHVIDISGSTNEKGEVVETFSHDPGDDIRFLEKELDMWYFGIIKKGWERFSRQVQQEKLNIVKEIAKQLSGLKANEEIVKEAIKNLDLKENIINWNDDELLKLSGYLRKKTKPMIIAANKIDVNKSEENLEKIKKEFPDYKIIGCSSESEVALKEANKHGLIRYISGENDFEVINGRLSEKQKNALDFIKKNVLDKFRSTGVQDILDYVVFDLLKNIVVYPVTNNRLMDKDGNVLPDCFIIDNNITALEFAFKIHGDIGKNFVKAIDLKTKQAVGKDHKLKNNDVIEIITK